MKKIYISTGLFLIMLQAVSAQVTITKQWEAYHTSPISGKNISNSLTTDAADNIYITGRSFESSSKGDFTTIMYDTLGVAIWEDFYASTGTGDRNEGSHIITDALGNIYAVGTSQFKGGDIAVVKYNTDGQVWSNNYTPSWYGSYEDEGRDIGVDSMGNIYVTGKVTSTDGNLDDIYTFKLDDASEVLWDIQYTGASAADYSRGIAVTKSGDCFTLGTSYNFFGSSTDDITTIHYDDEGSEQWIARYNGEGNDFDMAVDITLDATGNQYVCGATINDDNDNDMVIWKQNEFGTRLWTKIYNGSAESEDSAVSAIALNNGKVVALGRTREIVSGTEIDAMTLILLTEDGSTLWTKNYYGNDSAGAIPFGLAADTLGGIYLAGSEYSSADDKDAVVIKYDTTGSVVWHDTFSGAAGMNDIFRAIALDNKNNIIVTGQTFTSTFASDFITIRYHQQFMADTTGTVDTTGNTDTTQNTAVFALYNDRAITLYPDPASEILYLTYSDMRDANLLMYNTFGQAVMDKQKLDKMPTEIDISHLQTGIYIAEISDAAGEVFYKRFTVTR